MKIYLDGIPLQNPSSKLLKPTFTLRKVSDTGDRAYSFTGDLQFTEDDYKYLYEKLVTDPNAFENKVVLKFVEDCCSQNQVFEFWIDYKSLTWCDGSCDLTAAAVEKSLSNDQYTCLQNTIIWDDFDGFKSRQHPRMAYCNELRPNWMHDILIILTMATWTSFLVYGPMLILFASIIQTINFIIGIVNAVIGFVNTLGGSLTEIDPVDLDGDPSTNAYQEMNNWVNSLLAQSFGCGRKHPSPLVREYIKNVCKKCGITFQSSILNDPASVYYNSVYVNAPINKGTKETDTTTYWIDENAPIISGLQLLDQLVPVFVGKYEIVNSVLIFEREDFFIPKTPWLDLTTYDETKINKICWKWSDKNRYSYGSMFYQKDGVNWVGSEAVSRWGDIVDWNTSPYSPLQKGEYKPFIEFAACRFRDDGIDRDVLTFYEDLPTIGTIIKQYKNAMLMNSHTCYQPMLLIWDGKYINNASCDKFVNTYFPALAGVAGANQYYNYPYWFKQGYPGNLYSNFHYIKNPRVSNYLGFDVEIEIDYDCDLLSLIDIDGVIKTDKGDTKGPLTVVINTENSTLLIKGTI